MDVAASSRYTRAFVGALVAVALAVSALALIVPGLTTVAHAQTAPTCPTGSTFNAASGNCQVPATVTCPAGMTPTATACTATVLCPFDIGGLARFIVGNPTGATSADCLVVNFATIVCPAGTVTSFLFGVPPFGPGSITCTAAGTFSCPAGFTLGGTTCTAPATCPVGTLVGAQCEPLCGAGTVLFNGTCFPVGNAGPAFANGGNGGDARGGDGGRGGDGFAPQCNQNISDTDWADAPPTVICAAGASGGDAGDGGISDGGNGGLAFTDGFA